MKAAVIREHGGPDRIRIEDIPDPKPGDGDVVVDVRAAALNHLDIWVCKGGRAELTWPHVLGSDAAGVVAQVGPRVRSVRAGEQVVVTAGLSCGACEFCRSGQQSECTEFGLLGMQRPGTFAERIAVPAENVLPMPPHLDFNEAAALTLAHLTAWRMLFSRAWIQPGETVLIHGIGGGVAVAALQLARFGGAEVIATSSSNDKLRRAADLGAGHTINYKETPDVAAAVREITRGRGVDIAIDTVGAATWPIDLAAVRRGGRIVLCGVTTGSRAEADLQAIYWNQLAVFGSTSGSLEEFRRMIAAVRAAGLRPVIDSVFPLDQAREAVARMESGQQFGKIVLTVSE